MKLFDVRPLSVRAKFHDNVWTDGFIPNQKERQNCNFNPRKKLKEAGGNGVRTRGLSHAKRALYRWAIPPCTLEEDVVTTCLLIFPFVTSAPSNPIMKIKGENITGRYGSRLQHPQHVGLEEGILEDTAKIHVQSRDLKTVSCAAPIFQYGLKKNIKSSCTIRLWLSALTLTLTYSLTLTKP